MCQVSVYLDKEKIMDGVSFVEPVAEGIRLSKMFEEPRVVSAKIQVIDLMKNKLILKSTSEEKNNEKY